MRLTFGLGAAASVLALALLASGCGGGGDDGGSADGGLAGSEAAVTMEAVNDSGENGTASLFSESGGKTRVLIDTDGPFDREFEQPVEIVKGECPEPTGETAFELITLQDGISESTIDIPLEELRSGGYVIVVHKSATDDALTECGTIAATE
jgi:hypothetical protein